MLKQWMAMLSVIGLAGPAARVEAQVVKGSKTVDAGSKDAAKNHAVKQESIVSPRDPQSKLNLKQESLRKQNQGGGVTKLGVLSTTCGKNQNPSGGNQLNKGKPNVNQQNKKVGTQKRAYPPQSLTCQTGSKKVALTKGAAAKQNQNAPAPK